jgi:hypothetical protein
MSGRPRKSDRKSLTFSAGVCGLFQFPVDEGGKPGDVMLDTASSSDRSRSLGCVPLITADERIQESGLLETIW